MTASQQVAAVLARLGCFHYSSLRQAVINARWEARRDASREGRRNKTPFIRSRGTFLCTLTNNGPGGPNVAQDGPTWGGTKKEIEELVALVEREHPDVTEVYMEGAFDASDRMDFDDYDPRVAEWEVPIWTRANGYVNHLKKEQQHEEQVAHASRGAGTL